MPDFDPDKLLRDAQLNLAGGFDTDEGAQINRRAEQALKRLIDELLTRNLKEMKTGEMFKAFQALVKGVDEHVRLTQFCSGKADSRPDLGLPQDVMKCLTDEQLQQVMRWVTENAAVGGDADAV